MASMNESAPATASSPTHQSQAEARTDSSMPDITQHSLEHNPDIFTIICCNDSFQLALNHNHQDPAASVQASPSSPELQAASLSQLVLTPSDKIAISLHCDEQATADRSWLVEQAEQGNAFASYFLARTLQIDLNSDRIDKSERQAIHQQIFRLFESAANTNHTMAQFHLAQCYRNGIGVDRDRTKTIELYRSLADGGIPEAQIALGDCYESGEGAEQDYDSAIRWYSNAADQGSEDGRLHIVFLQAWFSFIGRGVEQSDIDAFNQWQEVSTQSTDPIIKPIATHMVGWMHYLGRGTVRDQQKGVKIICENKSDEFRLGEGECLVAWWTNLSYDSRAVYRFFKLCQLGSDRDWLCKHLMALCMLHGFGTAMNRKKAAGIFEQLAIDGHSDSQLWIGECYSCGGGVIWNPEKTFEWFRKSADQGNSYGQWRVGYCFYYGTGVAEDKPQAVEWYRKSAERGNRYGQCWLGDCYKNGEGVPQDIDTAIFWYRKSADQGNKDAINSLNGLGRWP
ncbi:uncharacterized protein BJ171DRAFT_471423 [Polychytrium aggregatum]|uniref:uncharacterized protein n=1 Tax=Polychytrium aggregatum TaxID=110093 RepID=UPI0022FF14CB|nr:uncharacterized protein BJ171DRAFT_471423 [Polychytrium aggregatum]KAI9209118.1 hypothetical protein BJ171DRAFT_471423 [Polychytrium aggregatum]